MAFSTFAIPYTVCSKAFGSKITFFGGHQQHEGKKIPHKIVLLDVNVPKSRMEIGRCITKDHKSSHANKKVYMALSICVGKCVHIDFADSVKRGNTLGLSN